MNYGKNDGKNLLEELTNNEKRILFELINNHSIPYDTLYTVDDNLMTGFAFDSGEATIYSFTSATETYKS